jgi:hypothetical protein
MPSRVDSLDTAPRVFGTMRHAGGYARGTRRLRAAATMGVGRVPHLHGLVRTALQGVDVGSIEAGSHTFVVRIWLERAGKEKAWRGSITHVLTEERHHFVELADVVGVIRSYLGTGEGPPQRADRTDR